MSIIGYSSVDDVQARNRARVISPTSVPCASDVAVYLAMTAGEINALLTQKGYQLPVPTAAAAAWDYLRNINSLGAWSLMEQAAQSSPHVKQAVDSYQQALKMLADADTVLDIPRVDTVTMPRGPGFTTPHVGQVQKPYFRRNMRF